MSKRPKKSKASAKEKASEENVYEMIDLPSMEIPQDGQPEQADVVSQSELKEPPPDVVLEPQLHEVTEEDETVEILNNFKEVDVVTPRSSKEKRKTRVKIEKTKFEERPRPPSSDERQEKKWSAEIKTHWWVAITGLSAMSALLIGLMLRHSDEDLFGVAPEYDLAPLPSEEDPYERPSEKWFHENMPANKKRAVEMIKQYLAAENHEERSQLMRDPENYLKHVTDWGIAFKPMADEGAEYKWSVETNGERSYLLMTGKNARFLPLRAYFVYDDEQDTLKLDWHATVGWSEAAMQSLRSGEFFAATEHSQRDDMTVLMRCYLTKKDELYLGNYNDREHSAFKLTSPDKTTFIWGYAQRDSALDQELRRLLDHGRFVAELKKDRPVTLRISKPRQISSSVQVELMELVHPEWVSP